MWEVTTSLNEGYHLVSGSVATAHVSGALAMLYAYRPDLAWHTAVAALLNGADQQPGLIGKVRSGGRLNVWESLNRLD